MEKDRKIIYDILDKIDDIKSNQTDINNTVNNIKTAICGNDELGIKGIVTEINEIKKSIDKLEKLNINKRLEDVERFKVNMDKKILWGIGFIAGITFIINIAIELLRRLNIKL